MAVSSTVKLSIVGIVGAVLFALGGIVYVIFPNIIKDKVYQNMRIVNGTELYRLWKDIPFPIYMECYFFNVTNADEILSNSTVKPVLQQLGPYTYREYRKRVNISFDEEGGTVRYDLAKWYVFEPNMTNGSLEDYVTTINIPLMGVGAVARDKLDHFQRMVLSNMIRVFKPPVFVTKTVDELLFRGYKDELMIFLAEKSQQEMLPNGRFGFFYNKNYTNYEEAPYVVTTGTKPNSKFLHIVSWNGSSSVPYWNDRYCNMINGTDGTAFSPFITKEDRLYGYVPEVCRTIYWKYEKDIDIHGIPIYRFSIPETLFDDHLDENQCFCVKKDDCYSTSLQDLSACKKGAPVALSFPHFFMANTAYVNAVVGLNPNKEEHGSFMDVQPMTGAVLRGTNRFQINIDIRPISSIKLLRSLPEVVLPIMWITEGADLGIEGAELLNTNLFRPILMVKAVILALIAIGSFILVIVIVVLIRNSVRNKTTNRNSLLNLALDEIQAHKETAFKNKST